MTVRELIEKLKEMPQDAVVFSEYDYELYEVCKAELEEYSEIKIVCIKNII